MTFWQRLQLTFLDKDGSVAVPEVVAAGSALVFLASAIRDFFDSAHPFPYAAVVEALGGIVIALATAQRVRDGLWKPGDRDHDGDRDGGER